MREDFAKRIGTTIGVIFLLNVAGKALGFLRVQQIGVQLGVSTDADALFLALTVASLWEAIAMSGACVPLLTGQFVGWEKECGFNNATARSTHVGLAVIGICLLLMIAVLVCAPWLVRLLAPGLSADGQSSFVTFVRILSFAPPFATLAILFATLTRLHGGEAWFAVTALLVNGISLPILVIAPNLGLGPTEIGIAYVSAICVGSFAAAVVQLLVLRADLRTAILDTIAGYFSKSLSTPHAFKASVVSFMKLWPPLVAAVAAYEVNAIVNIGFASTTDAGGIATFGYADRLVKIVVAVVVASLFVVFDPRWSRYIYSENRGSDSKRIQNDIATLILVVSPFYLVLAVTSSRVVSLLFGYGQIDASAIASISKILQLLTVASFLSVLSLVCVRILTFGERSSRIFRVNVTLIPINFALNLVVVPLMGLIGLAISSIVVAALQFVLMFRVLLADDVLGSQVSSGIFGWRTLAGVAAVVASIFWASAISAPWTAWAAVIFSGTAGLGAAAVAIAILRRAQPM